MNEDILNMSIRKFLKKVGITSQREIEAAVRKHIENGELTDTSSFAISVQLHAPELELDHKIDGKIELK
ncbi:hypothetical protein WH95_09770 [Kiloniella litopenaei]|uniref:Uncharacterized protein n=1 Tax=Kiloniella litopenaei TaxID=1549748 RepID=A0A0M2RBF9_9PROT|nr:DUF6494 family protein [Kiloniella litopenaei]KKJ76958.1 hypothetical protein WH95_09770 [Kiloniella litopenaei]